jgi:hypothetical protein
MTYSTNVKDENIYKLFVFSFSLAILTYGFALTNFTISIDNEIPIYPDYGLDLGRWGQNLIRYHLFKGHLQYFSLMLSLFLFSVAAVRLTKLFKFQDLSAYCFCALFVTFPQISYQVVFSMMADVAAFGVLLSVCSVELFIKALEVKSSMKKISLFLLIALILMFTLSIYQAFVLVPPAIYIIFFFLNTFKDSFKLNVEIKKMLLFWGIILISLVLYYVSVKVICPPIQDGGYLTSFVSGESDNRFLNFCSIWFKNLIGGFYYGERTFIVGLLASVFLFVRFFIEKKLILIRFLTLFAILLMPFLMSFIITGGYHPPRLYLTSNLVFAFVIVFALNHSKISTFNITKIALVLITITNIYFVTNLFYTVNKIYKHDKKIAEKIDYTIQIKYPKFSTTEQSVYFYGYFPYEYHQKFRLQDSEIFGGSIYNWDNGNNYRIINFFREADVAEYKMIDTKEKFDVIRDSMAKMPTWPNYESVRMFNNIVVVKLGNEKGMPVPGE